MRPDPQGEAPVPGRSSRTDNGLGLESAQDVEPRAVDRLLPGAGGDPPRLPPRRLPRALRRSAAGRRGDDRRSPDRPLAPRPDRAPGPGGALSEGGDAGHLRRRADRPRPIHVPRRARLRHRAPADEGEERRDRVVGRDPDALRARVAHRRGLPRRHDPLRREGLDRRGRPLHGRGDVDHRLPDARADHLRAWPLRDLDGHSRAGGRLGRRRGRLVHPRGRPRELLRPRRDRRLGDRRRHRLRPLRLLRPPSRPRAGRGVDREARGLRQRGPSRRAHAPRCGGLVHRQGRDLRGLRSLRPRRARCRGARSPGASRSRSSRSP